MGQRDERMMELLSRKETQDVRGSGVFKGGGWGGFEVEVKSRVVQENATFGGGRFPVLHHPSPVTNPCVKCIEFKVQL